MHKTNSNLENYSDFLKSSNHENIGSIERVDAEKKDPRIDKYNEEFIINEDRDYNVQYSSDYYMRFMKLKPIIEESAREKWCKNNDKPPMHAERILDVSNKTVCWVVGTIYCDMERKPNILDEVTKDQWEANPAPPDKYFNRGNDKIELDDISGRITLIGSNISNSVLVTGLIVGVLGIELANGDFLVEDIALPDYAPQIPLLYSQGERPSKYIAFLSGLNLHGQTNQDSYATELLVDFLIGAASGPKDRKKAADITNLIIAGNSIFSSDKQGDYGAINVDMAPDVAFDEFLNELCASMSVEILPGPNDPATIALPQQPLHPALFPLSRRHLNEHLTPACNPHWSSIYGLQLLGTSGQNIDDIYHYVEGDDRLNMMELTLRWRHITPTSPDTIAAYPFKDRDPFVIQQSPHIYYAGNQEKFATRIIEGPLGERIRLLSIPSFSKTGELILVNADTLEVEVLSFNVSK